MPVRTTDSADNLQATSRKFVFSLHYLDLISYHYSLIYRHSLYKVSLKRVRLSHSDGW